jgi:hypothetical protein
MVKAMDLSVIKGASVWIECPPMVLDPSLRGVQEARKRHVSKGIAPVHASVQNMKKFALPSRKNCKFARTNISM